MNIIFNKYILTCHFLKCLNKKLREGTYFFIIMQFLKLKFISVIVLETMTKNHVDVMKIVYVASGWIWLK